MGRFPFGEQSEKAEVNSELGFCVGRDEHLTFSRGSIRGIDLTRQDGRLPFRLRSKREKAARVSKLKPR
jgi:hypothetical protein